MLIYCETPHDNIQLRLILPNIVCFLLFLFFYKTLLMLWSACLYNVVQGVSDKWFNTMMEMATDHR